MSQWVRHCWRGAKKGIDVGRGHVAVLPLVTSAFQRWYRCDGHVAGTSRAEVLDDHLDDSRRNAVERLGVHDDVGLGLLASKTARLSLSWPQAT
jgi:hypothetical protein